MGTLQRIQDLFRRGEVLAFGEGDDAVFVYVAKLNAFEKDESMKDARSARARRMLAFDRDLDERDRVELIPRDLGKDELIVDHLNRRAGELLLKAEDEVRSDTKWVERLLVLDRSELVTDEHTNNEDMAMITALATEFDQAVQSVQSRMVLEYKSELSEKDEDELVKLWVSAWREMLGSTAFFETRRQSEIWFALRDCVVPIVDGKPDLEAAIIGNRLIVSRSEVNDLPDAVVVRILQSLDAEMTAQDAGNSDAPSASSGSSERQSAAEASKPSIPTET